MKDTKAKGIIVVVALLLAAVVTLGLASPAGAVGGYRVSWTGSDGLNVRSGPSTSNSIVGHLNDGAGVDLRCYVRGQLVNGRNNVWYQLNSPFGGGFVTASYINTPTDPLPGLPGCGSTPTTTSIGNRIADIALTYQGRWGGQACIDAGMGSGGYVGGYSGGQCRQFVNCLIWRASGHRYNPTSPDYSFSGASTVSSASAQRGDIIQRGIGGHTAIILINRGGGRFQVVDSNYSLNERVQVHEYTLQANSTIWRYSQAATG